MATIGHPQPILRNPLNNFIANARGSFRLDAAARLRWETCRSIARTEGVIAWLERRLSGNGHPRNLCRRVATRLRLPGPALVAVDRGEARLTPAGSSRRIRHATELLVCHASTSASIWSSSDSSRSDGAITLCIGSSSVGALIRADHAAPCRDRSARRASSPRSRPWRLAGADRHR